MSESQEYSVRLDRYRADGGTLRVIEKRLWTGQCFGFPRSLLSEVQGRYNDVRSGVYILWGFKGDHRKPCAYIGESDETFRRLETHQRTVDKDYWEQTVVFTSKDQGLNKAHVQYIEVRLVELARQGNRVHLMNATTPRTAPLSGADRTVAESFISDLLDCLAILGVDFFEPSQRATVDITVGLESIDNSTIATKPPISDELTTTSVGKRVLSVKSKGITAHGYESGNKFVVHAGSQAVKNETPSARINPKFKHIPNLRQKLISKGILIDAGDYYKFAENYAFDSPTAASCTVLGASSNGLATWKNENGRSLGEIRISNVAADDAKDKTILFDSLEKTPHYVYLRHKGIQARGYVSEDGFIVTRGSEAVGDKDVTNSIPRSSRELRQELITKSVLKREHLVYALTNDYDLISPSRAAGVLLGASYNGNKHWVDENGRQLGEIQR